MHKLLIIAFSVSLFAAMDCDKKKSPPRPKTSTSVEATLTAKPLEVGTAFELQIESESVVPRFLSKQKAKRTGQIRAVDTRNKIVLRAKAELLGAEPEIWRVEFMTFERTTQTKGAPEAMSTHDLPGTAFVVEERPEGTLVTLDVGAAVADDAAAEAVTESQSQYALGVVRVLQERHAWQKFAPSRSFGQGKIVAAPEKLVVGRFVEPMFGPLSEPHGTVSFFRFGETAGGEEIAIFDAHTTFKAIETEMTDGSYFAFEGSGKVRLRMADSALLGYDLNMKVTPRAKTGAMLPEGSGTWTISFEIDPKSFETP